MSGEMGVEAGEPAPDFTLPTDGGGSVTLSALRGQKVIVYFYPKDDTPGCTKEACAFRDALPDFTGAGAVVIGISPDGVAAHERFKAKYELPFTLAADAGAEVAKAWGVWVEKSMYGRRYMGIDRSTFLIGADGTVAKAWRKVKVTNHAAEVLKAAKAL